MPKRSKMQSFLEILKIGPHNVRYPKLKKYKKKYKNYFSVKNLLFWENFRDTHRFAPSQYHTGIKHCFFERFSSSSEKYLKMNV